ncbi:MAG: peptidylprolyl isomerase [Acidobacteria bacterium]|nr:peptidylprolyl isomerase [Acidobacteriota bacterium]
MRKLLLFPVALVFCGFCAAQQAPAPAAPAAKPAEPVKPAREPGLYGTMTTSMGSLTFKLFEKESPITVKNFVDLCLGRKEWRDPNTRLMTKRPLIPGTTFHRVIPGFMIQGGDPTGTGAGDVGFVIKDEFHPDLKFDRPGRFGMANAGPQTGSSQFFITEVPTPHLDGKHTIFAQVMEGQDLLNQIARVPRGQDDKPRTPVRILKVSFERVGPAPPNAPEGAPMKKAAAPAKTGAAAKAATPAKPAAPPAKK